MVHCAGPRLQRQAAERVRHRQEFQARRRFRLGASSPGSWALRTYHQALTTSQKPCDRCHFLVSRSSSRSSPAVRFELLKPPARPLSQAARRQEQGLGRSASTPSASGRSESTTASASAASSLVSFFVQPAFRSCRCPRQSRRLRLFRMDSTVVSLSVTTEKGAACGSISAFGNGVAAWFLRLPGRRFRRAEKRSVVLAEAKSVRRHFHLGSYYVPRAIGNQGDKHAEQQNSAGRHPAL